MYLCKCFLEKCSVGKEMFSLVMIMLKWLNIGMLM